MKSLFALLLCFSSLMLIAQTAEIKGQLQDPDGEAVIYANVALYNAVDSSLVKVETTDEAGVFRMQGLMAGTYNLSASYVGAEDLNQNELILADAQIMDLGVIRFVSTAIDLAEATVTASRVMVEVKPDRTIFNVNGTINSVGGDAISLLRKAPGVTVDNNNNVNVLGRAGVLLYVDGKRLPLQGDDLVNYLQNLPAEQIDRFEIITNPGAKYEAEGNAGIIDIRLKKDKNLGGNGSVSGSFSQGQLARYNGSASGNYRSKKMNVFATLGGFNSERFDNMDFTNNQNGIRMVETNRERNERSGYNYRLGTDFFLNDQHTIGFLISGNQNEGDGRNLNRIKISDQQSPDIVDSILVADNRALRENTGNSYNINYGFSNSKGRSLNIDLDYGAYGNDLDRDQPNLYFNADETELLTEINNAFEAPTDIEIYTAKLDFEEEVLGGKLGLGAKLSAVNSDNTFLVFDVVNGVATRDNGRSNIFIYDENVYAGYVNFSRAINQKWSFSAGLRAEQTDATGDLQAFDTDQEEPPVILNYLQWFPSAGLTWQVTPMNTLSLNYGRRINRPDYNVLNPFNNQMSELSYSKGNPFLRPEIVNNLELGYTLKYRYNFKLG
ncbi:MAG: TonB-dependent receptor, partial [Bacteroidota bacterium]